MINELRNEYNNAIEGINRDLSRVETLVSVLVSIYENGRTEEEATNELQMIQANLLRHVNCLNDIAMHAMAINEQQLYFACEDVKLEVRNTMEKVRALYM